jgi:hypothetical protein
MLMSVFLLILVIAISRSLPKIRPDLGWSQSRLLFPGPNGTPLSRSALHNALRRLNAAGERNSIRPHHHSGEDQSRLPRWDPLIQFRYRSNFFLRVEPLFELFERGNVDMGPQTKSQQSRWRPPPKFNYLDGSQ